MKTKTDTPRPLQKLIVISLAVAWLVSVVQIVALAAMQYSSNPNLSGFVGWALMSIVSPAILVGIIYLTRRTKKLTLKTLFEVSIAAVASLAIYGSVISLSVLVPGPTYLNDSQVLYYQLISAGVPLVITAAIMVFVLLRLRKAKQW